MAITTFKATAELQKGLQVKVSSRNFEILVDEPQELGGTDTGMNPVELTLGAFGSCLTIVAQIYAKHYKIEFEQLKVELEGDLDPDGFMNKADVRPGFSEIRYNFIIKTTAPKADVEKFTQFIAKTCPVGDSLENPVKLTLNNIVIH